MGSPASGIGTLMHVIPISLCLAPANNNPIIYSNFTQTFQTGSNYSHRLKAGTTPARSKFQIHTEGKSLLLPHFFQALPPLYLESKVFLCSTQTQRSQHH